MFKLKKLRNPGINDGYRTQDETIRYETSGRKTTRMHRYHMAHYTGPGSHALYSLLFCFCLCLCFAFAFALFRPFLPAILILSYYPLTSAFTAFLLPLPTNVLIFYDSRSEHIPDGPERRQYPTLPTFPRLPPGRGTRMGLDTVVLDNKVASRGVFLALFSRRSYFMDGACLDVII